MNKGWFGLALCLLVGIITCIILIVYYQALPKPVIKYHNITVERYKVVIAGHKLVVYNNDMCYIVDLPANVNIYANILNILYCILIVLTVFFTLAIINTFRE